MNGPYEVDEEPDDEYEEDSPEYFKGNARYRKIANKQFYDEFWSDPCWSEDLETKNLKLN